MSHETPVNVVLMWHMHQPQYIDRLRNTIELPWTFLHAIKDYSDMANILAECPDGKAVFNFSAILLEQINFYQKILADYFSTGASIPDFFLEVLRLKSLDEIPDSRKKIAEQCLRANDKNLIGRYDSYRKLTDIARFSIRNNCGNYLDDSFYFDLLTWYYLAWLGETIKRNHPEAIRLIKKSGGYSYEDRVSLLGIMYDIVSGIIPSYRALQKSGQIELSFTPGNHPILPLLIDFQAARETIKDVPLPSSLYPGGAQSAARHISSGLETFSQCFGFEPSGCWPSEGGISADTLELLAQHRVQWAASGGGVLKNSLHANHKEGSCIHHAFQFGKIPLTCFFRDDNLSDQIGFTYQGWYHEDAVSNLVHHIVNIRNACNNAPDSIIPIILDGENCWEYYPENGYRFLKSLYNTLSHHPDIRLTTFSEYLEKYQQPTQLDQLTAGSWVYGNFSTWIGLPDKNRGWELLMEAKNVFDQHISNLSKSQQQEAYAQLSICEASDWFWWLGDYNAATPVRDFDRLFRMHLHNLYTTLGVNPPEVLQQAICTGSGQPENDGTMRRSQSANA